MKLSRKESLTKNAHFSKLYKCKRQTSLLHKQLHFRKQKEISHLGQVPETETFYTANSLFLVGNARLRTSCVERSTLNESYLILRTGLAFN